LESSSLKCDDPFGEISFFNAPVPSKELVFDKYKIDSKSMVIGIYNEGNRISQKWDNEKIVELILDLQKKGNFNFFFLGTNQDETLNKLMENKGLKYNFIHLVEQIPILPFICRSDLLITPNSNLMHLAGITDTPQIALFGSYNPFRWAPIGKNKIFIKKSDFVNSICTNDSSKQIDKLLESDDGKN
jgi:heptosyltransferase-2